MFRFFFAFFWGESPPPLRFGAVTLFAKSFARRIYYNLVNK